MIVSEPSMNEKFDEAKAVFSRTAIKAGEINSPSGFNEEIAKSFVEGGLSEEPPATSDEALSIISRQTSCMMEDLMDMLNREKVILELVTAWQKGVGD